MIEDLLKDQPKEVQIVYNFWQENTRTLREIRKDHVDRQGHYTKQILDFLKLQLSVTPIILGFLFSLGINQIRDRPSLSSAVLLLTVHFIWTLIYLFYNLNKIPIIIFREFTRIEIEAEKRNQIAYKFLTGQEGVTFQQVIAELNKPIESDKITDLRVEPQMVFLQTFYVIAIFLIAITLINWSDFYNFITNFTK